MAGCQLIEEAKSISQNLVTSEAEISNHLSNDLQVQLSRLLITAQSHDNVTRLTDSILSTIKDPICPLALALVRTLCSVGDYSVALRIVDSRSAAGFDECDSTFIPSFDFQKAKILQGLGRGSPQHFNSALLGFEAQLGPNHITTLSCRYELAMQHVRSGDIKTAITILASLAETTASKSSKKKKSMQHLLQQSLILARLRYLQSLDSSYHDPQPNSTPIIMSGLKSGKRPLSNCDNETSPPAKRSQRSQEICER